jgi:quercetin dioxygenase-like cupin family protein
MKPLIVFASIVILSVIAACSSTNLTRAGKKQVNADQSDLSGYIKLDSIHYVGTGYLKQVTARKNYGIYRFVFEPGARNNWHLHPGAEQVLYVLEGEGYYQQEGKPRQLVKKGDVVVVPPDTKHWNGATAKTRLVQLSISDNTGGQHVKWFAAVSENEYLQ